MDSKQLSKFLSITFLTTWGSWIGLALLSQYKIISFSSVAGQILFMIGGFGPTFAAVYVLPGKPKVKSVLNFVFSRQRKNSIYFIIFCILYILVVSLASMELRADVQVFTIPIILVIATFIGGGNEELGWRGIMQPVLEKKFAFPVATLITGTVWSLWHVPLWFIDGTPQQDLSFAVYFMNAIFLSFWLATIYKKTGYLFYCCIFHGLFNTLFSILVVDSNPILGYGYFFLLVISILFHYKKQKSVNW